MANVLVLGDQLPRLRICASERPLDFILEALADRTEFALYELVEMPAWSMDLSSHLAKVDAVTP